MRLTIRHIFYGIDTENYSQLRFFKICHIPELRFLNDNNYDDSALDTETPKLLHQRLEEHSRRTVPWMWKVTDRLHAHAANGPGRETRRTRYRVYGVFLLALGVLP